MSEHTPGMMEADGQYLTIPRDAFLNQLDLYVGGEHQPAANASRIAAAWNACDGIPTDALTPGLMGEMRDGLR